MRLWWKGQDRAHLRERAIGHEPAVLECADAGDAFVVAVVMDQWHHCRLGGTCDQKIDGRHSAMVAVGGKGGLQSARAAPQLRRHLDRLEYGEPLRHLTGARLVWGQAGELQDHQIADEHMAGRDLSVEPGRKLREAPISRPRPHARVE